MYLAREAFLDIKTDCEAQTEHTSSSCSILCCDKSAAPGHSLTLFWMVSASISSVIGGLVCWKFNSHE